MLYRPGLESDWLFSITWSSHMEDKENGTVKLRHIEKYSDGKPY